MTKPERKKQFHVIVYDGTTQQNKKMIREIIRPSLPEAHVTKRELQEGLKKNELRTQWVTIEVEHYYE